MNTITSSLHHEFVSRSLTFVGEKNCMKKHAILKQRLLQNNVLYVLLQEYFPRESLLNNLKLC